MHACCEKTKTKTKQFSKLGQTCHRAKDKVLSKPEIKLQYVEVKTGASFLVIEETEGQVLDSKATFFVILEQIVVIRKSLQLAQQIQLTTHLQFMGYEGKFVPHPVVTTFTVQQLDKHFFESTE